MAHKNTDYNSWTLEEVRAEARKRSIVFVSKQGVRTVASKLCVHDRLMANPGDDDLAEETVLNGIEDDGVSNLSFRQRLELQERQLAMLHFRRKIKLEENTVLKVISRSVYIMILRYITGKPDRRLCVHHRPTACNRCNVHPCCGGKCVALCDRIPSNTWVRDSFGPGTAARR